MRKFKIDLAEYVVENTENMKELMQDKIIESANTFSDAIVTPSQVEIEFENEVEFITLEDAPESMTIKEVKDLNHLAKEVQDVKAEIISSLKSGLITVDFLEKLTKKLTELNDDEINEITNTLRDLRLHRACGSELLYNYEELVSLVEKIKK